MWWGTRLTKGAARAVHTNAICRGLVKIVYYDPVSTAVITGNTDKLDRNLHCKHLRMSKQGYTPLDASPELVEFMATCTDPTEFPSVLRDRSSTKYRTQGEIDKAARTALGVANATPQLPQTTVSDQNPVNWTPGTTDASNETAPAPTSELRRRSLRLTQPRGCPPRGQDRRERRRRHGR